MASPLYEISLCDRENNELADITTIASQKERQRWLSGAQVWSFRLPANHPDVSTVHTDGFRYMAKLARAVKVYRTPAGGGSPSIVANLLVIRCDWKGTRNDAYVNVTCADPMWWWRRRPVRDSLGRFALPVFPSYISAPEILLEALNQSITNEGTLGLDTATGTFETSGPDAGMKLDNWPVMLSELAVTLSNTGVCDIVIDPVDTADGFGLEDGLAIMGVANAYVDCGTDLSATVHFDYATGDHTLDECTVIEDADTIANRLYYYLGPRVADTERRYQGNITPPADGAPFDNSGSGGDDLRDTALETDRDASVTAYGQFFDIDVYDDAGAETSARPLFQKMWLTELRLRLNGRTLIKATPSILPGFYAYEDFNPGDIVAINTGAKLGVVLSGADVRVYGERATIDDNGVEHPGELILSADQEG
jgi:hypothetical protein